MKRELELIVLKQLASYFWYYLIYNCVDLTDSFIQQNIIYILAPSLFTLLKIKPIKSKFAFYILHYYKFYGI